MNEREIFAAALQLATSQERAAYLQRACGNDPELRERIEALLAEQDRLGSFLEKSPVASPPPTVAFDAPERAGSQIGPYKLLQVLGEGGMGVVYMADQLQPVMRRVALKIIKPGMDTRQVIARFEAERQALALMDHPNIAKVLDAGATPSGRPYFVMELVKGVPITQYCDQQQLTPNQRLELFLPICRAVQHAHQKGIIHRDLKPSNVLMALYDGEPVPKVIDFGVAKATSQRLTEKTMFTEVGSIIGTLEYMAPEQAELNNLDIDTRADIYSLGVILYELLTGSPPFSARQLRSAAFTEMLRMIREEEPPRPSTRLTNSDQLPTIAANRHLEPKRLTRLVQGDLDWIVMKCLEKQRQRRYETANGLALDLERFLHNEVVLAGPPSAAYQFRKYVHRNRGLVVAASVVLLAVLLGAIGTTAGLVRAAWERRAKESANESAAISDRAAKAATKAEGEAKVALARAVAAERDVQVAAHLSQARAYRHSGQPGQRFKCLEELAQAAKLGPPSKVLKELRDEAIAALVLTDLRPVVLDEGDSSEPIGFDSHFRYLARIDDQNILRILRVADQTEIARFPLPQALVQGVPVAFSPDGTRIYTSEGAPSGATRTVIREIPSGRELQILDGSLCGLSNDGSRCATLLTSSQKAGQKSTVIIRNLSSGALEKQIELGPTPGSLAFDPELNLLSQKLSGLVRVWDATTGAAIWEIANINSTGELQWDASGRYLTCATSVEGRSQVWDVPNRRLHATTDSPRTPILRTRINPRGDLLASAGYDTALRLWDTLTGQQVIAVRGAWGQVQFSADGRLIGPTRNKSQLLAWEIAEGTVLRRSFSERGAKFDDQPRIGLDHRRLLVATSGRFGGLTFWNRQTGDELAHVKCGTIVSRFDPTDGSLLTAGDRGLHRWPVVVEQRLAGGAQTIKIRIGPPKSLGVTYPLVQLDLTPDGQRAVATCYAQRGMMIVDLKRPEEAIEVRTGMNVRSAITGDGRWVVAGPSGFHVATMAWDAHTGQKAKSWNAQEIAASSVAVDGSDDGQWLATSSGAALQIWKTVTWQLGATIPLEQATYGSYPGIVGFSPDNRLVAYAKSGLIIALIDRNTGEEVALLPLEGAYPMSGVNLWFTSDGGELAVGRESKTATVWDLRKLREELAKIGLDWDAPAFVPAAPLSSGTLSVEVDLGGVGLAAYPASGTAEQKVAFFNQWIESEPNLVQLYYRRAIALISAQQREAAAVDLERYLSARPHDASALSLQARLLAKLDRSEESEQSLKALQALDPPSSTAEVLGFACYELANFYAEDEALRDWSKAYRLAKRAATLAPVTFNQSLLGRASYREGRYQEAIDALQVNLSLETATYYEFHDRFLTAMAQKKLGQQAQAEASLERALARFEQVHNTLTDSQLEDANLWRDEALALFGRPPALPSPAPDTKAVSVVPSAVESLRAQGLELIAKSDLAGGLAALQAALKLAPSEPNLLGVIASTQLRQDDVAAAIGTGQRLLAVAPGQYSADNISRACSNLILALAYRRDSTPAQKLAVQLGQRAVELSPGAWQAHERLGVAYFEAQRWSEAVAELQIALPGATTQKLPCNTWRLLAMAEQRQGNRQRTSEYLATMEQWLESNQQTLSAESLAYNTSMRDAVRRALNTSVQRPPAGATPQERVEFYAKVVADDPDDLDAYRSLAFARQSVGDRDGMLAACLAGLERKPANPPLLAVAGRAYALLRQTDKAREMGNRLLAIEPDVTNKASLMNACNELSTFNVSAAPELAVKLSERAVALDEGKTANWAIRYMLGVAYYRAGRFEEAVPALEASLEGAAAAKQPYYPLFYLAMAERRRGNLAKAKEYLEQGQKWISAHDTELPPENKNSIQSILAEVEAVFKEPAAGPQFK